MGNFTFGVDTTPPFIESFTPQDDAFGIPVSTPINIEINDIWSGIDVTSIVFTIAFGEYSYSYTYGAPSNSFGTLEFLRDEFDNNINIEFSSVSPFPPGENFQISLDVSDLTGNAATTFRSTFDTADVANFSTFTGELALDTFLAGTWEKTVDIGCIVKWKALEWVGPNVIDEDGSLVAYSLFQVAPYNGVEKENCEKCSGVLGEDAPTSPVNFYGESGVTGSGGVFSVGSPNVYDSTKPFVIDLTGQSCVFVDGPHAGEEYIIATNTEDTLSLVGFSASVSASSVSYEAGDNIYFSATPANISIVPDSTKALVKVWMVSNRDGITPVIKNVNLVHEELICRAPDNLRHYMFDTLADELHSNRMSVYHSEDGLLHFRIYDNSKSAFPKYATQYEKNTEHFVHGIANNIFIDANNCDDDSDIDCNAILQNAVSLKAANQELCGTYRDKGVMSFNYNDEHESRCTSDQRNFYEITADISDWNREECHTITTSWRLNNRQEGAQCSKSNCEMHLFIDGVEVPNIIKFGTGVLYGNVVYGGPSPLQDDLGIVSTRCKITQLTRSDNDPIYLCSNPRTLDSIKVVPVGWIQDRTVQWNRGEAHDIRVDGNEMRLNSPPVCVDGDRIDPTLTAQWPCTYKHFGIFVSEIHDAIFNTHWETVGWDIDYSYNLRQNLVNDTDCAGDAADPCSNSRVSGLTPVLLIDDFEVHFDNDFEGYIGEYHDGYGTDPYAHLPDGYDANCDETDNCDEASSAIDTSRIFVRVFYRVGDHPDAMGLWTRAQDMSCRDGYQDCLANMDCDFGDSVNENGRYIQYRTEFFSDTFETPVIKSVRFVGQPITLDGCFTAAGIIPRADVGLREIVFRNSTG